jgi:hypothetical protein
MNEETNLQLAENPALLIAGVSHSFSKYQHVERLGTTKTRTAKRQRVIKRFSGII